MCFGVVRGRDVVEANTVAIGPQRSLTARVDKNAWWWRCSLVLQIRLSTIQVWLRNLARSEAGCHRFDAVPQTSGEAFKYKLKNAVCK